VTAGWLTKCRRSIVSLLQDESRLEHVSTCPTQFQQYVPGVDYRVHVVGDELFACRIESSAIDYRYVSWAGQSTQVRPATRPDGVAQKCRSLCVALGLGLAGIDLRQDADGRW
jgi:glutathione synthase/RimK-type ligase-like ATP-grasp enzyme